MPEYIELPKRPRSYPARNFQFDTACGSVFVSVSMDENHNPREVFITKGNSGGCTQAFSEAMGRIVSIALRCGVNPREIIVQYSQIKCDNGSWQQGVRVTSCPGAVALALKSVLDGGDITRETAVNDQDAAEPENEPTPEEMKKRFDELAKKRRDIGI